MTEYRRRTRILATLGPATDAPGVLDALIAAGVDCVRLNFSHGDPASQVQRAHALREAAARAGREIGILADLPGPKIRVETFADGKVEASPEQPLTLPLVLAGKHPLKMTACVALPQNIVRQATADDLMAAFVGAECRGMAKAEQAENGEYVFRMEINGSMGAEEPVTLKYYAARNKCLYQAVSAFTFAGGASYGTAGEPSRPAFLIVE